MHMYDVALQMATLLIVNAKFYSEMYEFSFYALIWARKFITVPLTLS